MWGKTSATLGLAGRMNSDAPVLAKFWYAADLHVTVSVSDSYDKGTACSRPLSLFAPRCAQTFPFPSLNGEASYSFKYMIDSQV
jgi:hypothetical protein